MTDEWDNWDVRNARPESEQTGRYKSLTSSNSSQVSCKDPAKHSQSTHSAFNDSIHPTTTLSGLKASPDNGIRPIVRIGRQSPHIPQARVYAQNVAGNNGTQANPGHEHERHNPPHQHSSSPRWHAAGLIPSQVKYPQSPHGWDNHESQKPPNQNYLDSKALRPENGQSYSEQNHGASQSRPLPPDNRSRHNLQQSDVVAHSDANRSAIVPRRAVMSSPQSPARAQADMNTPAALAPFVLHIPEEFQQGSPGHKMLKTMISRLANTVLSHPPSFIKTKSCNFNGMGSAEVPAVSMTGPRAKEAARQLLEFFVEESQDCYFIQDTQTKHALNSATPPLLDSSIERSRFEQNGTRPLGTIIETNKPMQSATGSDALQHGNGWDALLSSRYASPESTLEFANKNSEKSEGVPQIGILRWQFPLHDLFRVLIHNHTSTDIRMATHVPFVKFARLAPGSGAPSIEITMTGGRSPLTWKEHYRLRLAFQVTVAVCELVRPDIYLPRKCDIHPAFRSSGRHSFLDDGKALLLEEVRSQLQSGRFNLAIAVGKLIDNICAAEAESSVFQRRGAHERHASGQSYESREPATYGDDSREAHAGIASGQPKKRSSKAPGSHRDPRGIEDDSRQLPIGAVERIDNTYSASHNDQSFSSPMTAPSMSRSLQVSWFLADRKSRGALLGARMSTLSSLLKASGISDFRMSDPSRSADCSRQLTLINTVDGDTRQAFDEAVSRLRLAVRLFVGVAELIDPGHYVPTASDLPSFLDLSSTELLSPDEILYISNVRKRASESTHLSHVPHRPYFTHNDIEALMTRLSTRQTVSSSCGNKIALPHDAAFISATTVTSQHPINLVQDIHQDAFTHQWQEPSTPELLQHSDASAQAAVTNETDMHCEQPLALMWPSADLCAIDDGLIDNRADEAALGEDFESDQWKILTPQRRMQLLGSAFWITEVVLSCLSDSEGARQRYLSARNNGERTVDFPRSGTEMSHAKVLDHENHDSVTELTHAASARTLNTVTVSLFCPYFHRFSNADPAKAAGSPYRDRYWRRDSHTRWSRLNQPAQSSRDGLGHARAHQARLAQ